MQKSRSKESLDAMFGKPSGISQMLMQNVESNGESESGKSEAGIFVTPQSGQMLLSLRWLALLGQLAILAISYSVLQIELSYFYLLGVAVALGCSNYLLRRVVNSRNQISRKLVGWVLVFDILLLTVALGLTAGPANPFSILYLVHIALAAVLLNEQWTWVVAGLTTLMFGVLFPLHSEVAGLEMHHHGSGFSAHLQGMWIAFTLTALLLAYFVCRILKTIRARDEELVKARLLMAHNERFSSLTTLAAGAAHELATPLSTIGVVAEELERELGLLALPAGVIEDIKILRSEVNRSAKIIDELRGQADLTGAEEWSALSWEKFVAEISEKIGENSARRISFFGLSRAPVYAPHHGLRRTIVALLQNAFDAGGTDSPVAVYYEQSGDFNRITIQDTGAGMTAEILEKACEPFFTTKATGRGMGLGLFLARIFCEKHSGNLNLKSAPGQGTTVTILLPTAESFKSNKKVA